MSKLNLCDTCGSVITPHSKKHVLGINTIVEPIEDTEENQVKNMEDLLQEYKKRIDNLKVYEICESCKKVLNHLFKLRKDELKKIKKELDNIERETEEQSNLGDST